MNQVESEWKLVIKLDITAFKIRYEQLQNYLKDTEKRCEKVIAGNAQKQQSVKQSSKQFQAHVGTENSTCPICQNTHKIFQCLIFRDMSVQARLEKVKSSRLCYNCLKPFHGKKCTYGSCKKCYKHHNTLLHNDKTADSNTLPLEADKGSSTAKQNVLSSVGAKSDKADGPKDDSYSVNNFLSSYHTRHSTLTVLLSIAVVHVRDRHRNLRECRALLDSGLQPNFISQELSECLELPQQNTDVIVRGVNNVSSTPQYETTATICSRFNKYQETLSFLVVDKVTGNLPPISINVNSFQIPSNIKLADPAFHTPGKIDLILGSEVFWRLLCIGQIQLGKSKPIFQKTKLGCIRHGKISLLPHHAVLKPDSDTTKLRVVFDASAKTSSGLSLNDVQMVGPTIQQDLFNILTRFRQHVHAVSADVTKMYRQIKVNLK
ncbi:hypothetical protein ALC62_11575 [Cyphomyrmex costatus]|uniref:Uncharacterized protein n=1 Tax=Cyphomyrmex costatus TaxID=456900 RepID=A0A151ICC1_9HYME|nr:hypothetical protein ALC62_11575 [Cyphomyrmex costatus]